MRVRAYMYKQQVTKPSRNVRDTQNIRSKPMSKYYYAWSHTDCHITSWTGVQTITTQGAPLILEAPACQLEPRRMNSNVSQTALTLSS
jgi:hypothetical protein